MSLHQQARQLIDQAGIAIQAGNPQYATELLRQSITYNGKDAEAFILLGIALAQTKMPADAENAFKRATQMAPDNVKARYNLAVHQYSQGQVRAALTSARKACELDVLHKGSQDLVTLIEQELGIEPGAEPKTTAAGNPTPPPAEIAYRDGYEAQPVRTLPFITRLGVAWTAFGWTIALMSLVLGGVFISAILPYSSSHSGDANAIVLAMSADPKISLIKGLYVTVNLCGLVFVATDAINRRGNLLWLLPQVACGCAGFTFLTIPIYLLWGRDNIGNGLE
jgi:tetratricopeptide (TPR) repeat protein